jgi:hypothetical protein
VGFERVEEDGAQLVVEVAVIGDPLRIGRPDGAEVGAEAAVDAVIDQHRLAGGHIDVPEAQVLVGVGDVFGIGRPGGVVEEAGIGAEIDDGGRLEAGLVVEVELIFAGRRRSRRWFCRRAPGGVALGHAGKCW